VTLKVKDLLLQDDAYVIHRRNDHTPCLLFRAQGIGWTCSMCLAAVPKFYVRRDRLSRIIVALPGQ
jgi:hypothetical protein